MDEGGDDHDEGSTTIDLCPTTYIATLSVKAYMEVCYLQQKFLKLHASGPTNLCYEWGYAKHLLSQPVYEEVCPNKDDTIGMNDDDNQGLYYIELCDGQTFESLSYEDWYYLCNL